MQTVESIQPAAAGSDAAKKRKARSAIVIFVLVMAALTLFSNTLLTLSLPQVTVERPAPGTLRHEIRGSGVVEAAEIVDLNISANWTVEEIKVKAGDRVEAGQELIVFNTDAARSALQDEEARYEQKKIGLGKLKESYKEADRKGDVQALAAMARDIESAKLDLDIQERKVSALKRQLASDAVLKSPVSGIVREVNAVKGLPVPAGKSAVRVTDLSKGLRLKALVAIDKAQYASVGDEAEIIFASLNNARIKATIEEINDAAASANAAGQSASQAKEIVFSLSDDRLKGGEIGEFTIIKRTAPARMLLPNEAIREDDRGAYVLVLKEKKGPLGNEFYLQKAAVTTGDADDEKTSVESGVTPLDKVVVSSNEPVSDGDRVTVAGGG
jgi:RND family efflux transporter MFP subunit